MWYIPLEMRYEDFIKIKLLQFNFRHVRAEKSSAIVVFAYSYFFVVESFSKCIMLLKVNFKKDFMYLLLERRREGERERNINMWLPHTRPLLGTWSATQACALTGNQTGDSLVHRSALSPLSYTSQSMNFFL